MLPNFLRRIQGERRQFAVLGLGRFGKAVCQTLVEAGYEVLGVDRNPELVSHIVAEQLPIRCIQANTSNPLVLREIGIKDFDTVIVAIGNYLEESIITTLHVKETGVKNVIAKASSEVHGTLLKKVGADVVVYPEAEMGKAVARSLTQRGILERLELDDNNSIVEAIVPPSFDDKSILELKLRANYGVTIVAIAQDGKYEINPRPDRKLEQGTMIVLIGANKDISRLPINEAPKRPTQK